LTDDEQSQPGPKQQLWGWPPTPKMQIMIIAGICVLINIILIGVWVLVLYLR